MGVAGRQPAAFEPLFLHHLGDGRQGAEVEIAFVGRTGQQENGVNCLRRIAENDTFTAAPDENVKFALAGDNDVRNSQSRR